MTFDLRDMAINPMEGSYRFMRWIVSRKNEFWLWCLCFTLTVLLFVCPLLLSVGHFKESETNNLIGAGLMLLCGFTLGLIGMVWFGVRHLEMKKSEARDICWGNIIIYKWTLLSFAGLCGGVLGIVGFGDVGGLVGGVIGFLYVVIILLAGAQVVSDML